MNVVPLCVCQEGCALETMSTKRGKTGIKVQDTSLVTLGAVADKFDPDQQNVSRQIIGQFMLAVRSGLALYTRI